MQTYTVRPGDTLSRIAATIYRDPSRWRLLAAANHLKDPRYIFVGQTLVLPEGTNGQNRQSAEAAAWAADTKVSQERLARVAPVLADRGLKLVQRCREAGVRIQVDGSLRTWAQQDALYASGRTKSGKVVTNARGGQSFHNFGLAFDILLLDASGKVTWDGQHPGWRIAGRAGVAVGLLWGGDWKGFKDLPHFEIRGQLSLADCCDLYTEAGEPDPAGTSEPERVEDSDRLQRIWERLRV
jgi:LysM repeat protein